MFYNRSRHRAPVRYQATRMLSVALASAVSVLCLPAFTSAGRAVRRAPEGYVLSANLPTPGGRFDRIDAPFGVALDASKNVYVVESSHVARLKSDGTLLLEFGKFGSGDGTISNAAGIVIDARGNLLITDSFDNQVKMFSPRGEFLGAIGSRGSDDGQFDIPIGIALDKTGNIYVADQENNRVEKFNSRGEFLLSIRRPDSEKGHIRWVAVDGRGNLYAVDALNMRIDKFTTSGRYLSSFGSAGDAPNQFRTPEGIGVDALGNIYVADGLGVKKFDPRGNLLTFINGNLPGLKGIVVEPDGTVYATRGGDYCVSIFKPAH